MASTKRKSDGDTLPAKRQKVVKPEPQGKQLEARKVEKGTREKTNGERLGKQSSKAGAEFHRPQNARRGNLMVDQVVQRQRKDDTGSTKVSVLNPSRGKLKEDQGQKRQGKQGAESVRVSRLNPSREKLKADQGDKRQRKDDTESVRVSVLNNEERAFPRGGASILTPLEHKQIQNEATRDALFEQSGQNAEGTSELEDRGKEELLAQGARKRKMKAVTVEEIEKAEAPVRIEGLNFKRLVPGSFVLGQVSRINVNDVSLALPNNLTGFIPLTSISDKITSKVEKLLAQDEKGGAEHNGEGAETEVDDVDLKSYCTDGQYLRACVVSSLEEEVSSTSRRGKKRIELSINPREANQGLSKSDLVVNSMVQASVKSVEDHGYVMDLGLDDKSVRGFMSSKDVGQNLSQTKIKEGAVLLCLIKGTSSNGKIVKLSADLAKAGNLEKTNYLAEAPTIDTFLPGTAIEMLISHVSAVGITGKVMGMLDATADVFHSGAAGSDRDLMTRFQTGQKAKARIIFTLANSSIKKIGVSLLEHVMALSPPSSTAVKRPKDPLGTLPLSSIVESATVVEVFPSMGLFVDLGVQGVPGFVHISMVADNKIERLSESSGPHRVGSVHRARVVGFNAMDGLFIVSLEKSILERAFLRIEDIVLGEVVKGKVERIVVNDRGVGGVLVNLAEGITGLVPELHMADVHLQYPEKKFREGGSVTARVLSTDLDRRQIRLTFKKSLVNNDLPVWTSYDQISPGSCSLGTIINIVPRGAVVQFFGSVRAFLPVSEMSEIFIKDPAQHFRLGQVVNVHVLSVDPESQRMTVSCKDQSAFGSAQRAAFEKMSVGDRVAGTATEKSSEDVMIELADSQLKATLKLGHLTDGSEQKELSTFKRLRVGQPLQDLVVLEKSEKRPLVILTNKPSLLKAAEAGELIRSFDDVREGTTVRGFVRNITPDGVFVQFAGGLVGLLHKSQLPTENLELPDYGFRKIQSVKVSIHAVDHSRQRFLLSMKKAAAPAEGESGSVIKPKFSSNSELPNPVDGESHSITDFKIGKLTKARITSVKETQLNVELAPDLQGRIDISEVFSTWDEISDKKHPLEKFRNKQVLDAKILGIHDARNHRFLPITHREGKRPVFELSARNLDQEAPENDILTLDRVEVGSSWIAFVNNIAGNCLWVNVSPNVRGRLDLMDISDDLSLLGDLEKNFPVGSALQVHVKRVDPENNRLDLTAVTSSAAGKTKIQDLNPGMVLPGRVTKVTERAIMVQLSDNISGPVTLTEIADDYEQADPTTYKKNEIVRVCILDVDAPNKRVLLSTRPSKVLSSSLPVKDQHISGVEQLKINDLARGFVKNVSDQGVFVSLSPKVTAFVRVSDLSDSFLKDWKSDFEVDQLVTGKVVAVDPSLNHIQMSLKASVMDKDYVPPITFNDLKKGQVVTGKVRKVEDFGVFIVVDGSANVSGLCHRSEVADQRVEDVRTLYDEGDAVKAVVLKIEPEKRRVSFGLKASYFKYTSGEDTGADTDHEVDDDDLGGVQLTSVANGLEAGHDNVAAASAPTGITDGLEFAGAEEEDSDADMQLDGPLSGAPVDGLKTNGFDWDGTLDMDDEPLDGAASESEHDRAPKKKRRKPEIKVDKTGDLDRLGPQSVADFERQLLGQPNSSSLWVQYMAFQLQLGEVNKAREIAERAIKTIHIREEEEKTNVWIALLNLENTYGSEETLEEVFKRACQFNDPQEMHEKLTSIYIESGKHQQADTLFQTMTKTKSFTPFPSLWLNYAHFLLTTFPAPQRARALLPRAMQSVAPHQHISLTSHFAALEFRSPHGDPERGRTIFEGLVTTWPRRWTLWDQWVDLETGLLERGAQGGNQKDIGRDKDKDKGKGNGTSDTQHVRALYERMSGAKMKSRRARYVFKRWLAWEEKWGGKKDGERVKARAEEYVRGVKGAVA